MADVVTQSFPLPTSQVTGTGVQTITQGGGQAASANAVASPTGGQINFGADTTATPGTITSPSTSADSAGDTTDQSSGTTVG